MYQQKKSPTFSHKKSEKNEEMEQKVWKRGLPVSDNDDKSRSSPTQNAMPTNNRWKNDDVENTNKGFSLKSSRKRVGSGP